MIRILILGLLMVFSLFGQKDDPTKIGEREVDKGINLYSIEKEISLGKQLAQDVEKHSKFVDDPIVAEYVNRICQNLVRNSDAMVPFTIKVIDQSQEVNAFALPGGFLFVNSGTLLTAKTEAEFAGVLAHEIAHVAARHGTRQASKGRLINYASIPLIFMGGWTGYGIRQAAGFAIPMSFMKFKRSYEAEADYLGIQYLWKSGYDPTEMVSFFETLMAKNKRKPGTMSKLFASHPPHGDRIQKIQKSINEVLPPKGLYVVSGSEFLNVKSRLESKLASRQEKRNPKKPRLRKGATRGKVGPNEEKKDEDDRPVLKRR